MSVIFEGFDGRVDGVNYGVLVCCDRVWCGEGYRGKGDEVEEFYDDGDDRRWSVLGCFFFFKMFL